MKHIRNDFIFHATTTENAVRLLSSNAENGLSIDEANDRLTHFGANAIDEAGNVSAFTILIGQFKSPIVFLLFFAATVSFFFQEWLDGIAILLVLLVNAAIGLYMELKAQKSVNALKKLSSIPAKVLRNSKLTEINSEEIVPGDIVFTEAGDMIPADGIIVHSTQLMIDESALTGESVPVDKKIGVLPESTILGDRVNMAFKATHVSKGNAHILVASTGMKTELGKIANLIHTAKQAATPLEKKLEQFSKRLILITIGLVVIIFIIGLINGEPFISMLQTAIALAVAAIPEGLPIVATMSLAQGMLKMARYNVIVKKLSAVETLGGTNVICTDKTGTLTQNKMEVVFIETPSGNWKKNVPYTGNKVHLGLISQGAVLCSTANIQTIGNEAKEIGDPLEIALLKFSKENGENVEKIRKEFLKKGEEPFSSETKIMSSLHEHEGSYYVFAKGAPEELLMKCTQIYEDGVVAMGSTKKDQWKATAEKFSASGHRMIAIAYRQTDSTPSSLTEELVFLGLVAMIDPPRLEVQAAIKDCKAAGIKVVMITGDHPSTAHFIATQLGISTVEEVPIVGKDMKEYEVLTEDEKQHWINSTVFARVNPAHKLDLVKVFQEKGYVVGMTGDGVNDAPAIKKADIGIAMGLRGTQVAQEVSDMVLKDDSFSSIVVAIWQGRVIFENIKKFVTFLLSCNLSELLVIAIVAVVSLQFQLAPLQILFINLITDVLPALALGVTKGGDDIMLLPPRKSSEPVVDNRRWKLIFFYAVAMAAASIGAVLINHYLYDRGEFFEGGVNNNILFFTLILCQLLHVFNMGTGSFFRTEVIKNKYVWASVVGSFLILLGAIQITSVGKALRIVPMSLQQWSIIIAAAVASVIIIQAAKTSSFFRQKGRTRSGLIETLKA